MRRLIQEKSLFSIFSTIFLILSITHAQADVSTLNRAVKKPVIYHTGGVYRPGEPYGEPNGWQKIVDGDLSTGWLVYTNLSILPTVATIDLREIYDLTSIAYKVSWDGSSYYGNSALIRIKTSMDNANWTLIDERAVSRYEYVQVDAYQHNARFIKLEWGGTHHNGWGHIHEIEAYGLPNVAKNKPIILHSGEVYETSNGAYGEPEGWNKIVDGDKSSSWLVWTNKSYAPTKAVIDLGADHALSSVAYKVRWDSNYGDEAEIRVQSSMDNANWTVMDDRQVGQSEYIRIDMGLTDARFIKFEWVGSNWNGWGHVFEVEAFGAVYLPTNQFISGGAYHSVGLKSNGKVVAVGYNVLGQNNVSGWTDIIDVFASMIGTVGLKSDGTVVTAGNIGICDVEDWDDIVKLSYYLNNVIGLRSDATVVATGDNTYGQCNVNDWTDIVAVASGGTHTIGLKSDGTVVAVGNNSYGEIEVGNWTNIQAIYAFNHFTIGLKSNGTLVTAGYNNQCDVENWTDIVQIAMGNNNFVVGLKSDGTLVAAGDNTYGQCDIGNWNGIVQVAAGVYHTLGLKSDGTVVGAGSNSSGQLEVMNWSDIGY